MNKALYSSLLVLMPFDLALIFLGERRRRKVQVSGYGGPVMSWT